MSYQDINSKIIDSWCEDGWTWGLPITHEEYEKALAEEWGVLLTPTKMVPKEWFGDLKGKKLLGLASGGGQLEAGFWLTNLMEDTDGYGFFQEYNVPTFIATRAVK